VRGSADALLIGARLASLNVVPPSFWGSLARRTLRIDGASGEGTRPWAEVRLE